MGGAKVSVFWVDSVGLTEQRGAGALSTSSRARKGTAERGEGGEGAAGSGRAGEGDGGSPNTRTGVQPVMCAVRWGILRCCVHYAKSAKELSLTR